MLGQPERKPQAIVGALRSVMGIEHDLGRRPDHHPVMPHRPVDLGPGRDDDTAVIAGGQAPGVLLDLQQVDPALRRRVAGNGADEVGLADRQDHGRIQSGQRIEPGRKVAALDRRVVEIGDDGRRRRLRQVQTGQVRARADDFDAQRPRPAVELLDAKEDPQRLRLGQDAPGDAFGERLQKVQPLGLQFRRDRLGDAVVGQDAVDIVAVGDGGLRHQFDDDVEAQPLRVAAFLLEGPDIGQGDVIAQADPVGNRPLAGTARALFRMGESLTDIFGHRDPSPRIARIIETRGRDRKARCVLSGRRTGRSVHRGADRRAVEDVAPDLRGALETARPGGADRGRVEIGRAIGKLARRPVDERPRDLAGRHPRALIADAVAPPVAGVGELAAIPVALVDDAADRAGKRPAFGAVQDHLANCGLALDAFAPRLEIERLGEALEFGPAGRSRLAREPGRIVADIALGLASALQGRRRHQGLQPRGRQLAERVAFLAEQRRHIDAERRGRVVGLAHRHFGMQASGSGGRHDHGPGPALQH